MYIAKKVKRSIGVLSKLRYFVSTNTLITMYYAMVYPFLIFSIISWGNTYSSTIQPLFVLQKRAIRIMTFSKCDEHSSPIFKSLKIIKLCDTLYIVIFMSKFHHQMLSPAFELFFTPVENVLNYNTRSLDTQSYYLPKIH